MTCRSGLITYSRWLNLGDVHLHREAALQAPDGQGRKHAA